MKGIRMKKPILTILLMLAVAFPVFGQDDRVPVWNCPEGYLEFVADPQTISYSWIEFAPKKDITAFELAKCMNVFIKIMSCNNIFGCFDGAIEAYRELPQEAKRHFIYHE